MKRYQAFSPDSEMTGTAVLSFTRNILYDEIETILKRHKLDNIDPAAWYPIQSMLDVMSDIADEDNASQNFVSLGIKAAQLLYDAAPESFKKMPFDQFMMNYSSMYPTRFRNGDAGWADVEKIDANHYLLKVRTPFPDDTVYGAIYGYTKLLRPPDTSFTVKYDPDLLRRDNGGEYTAIHITLQPVAPKA